MKPVTYDIVQADCLKWLPSLPADSVDLVFGSPPYERARLYLEEGRNLGIARDTEEWVAWMVKVFTECQRVCRGLVAFVVAGQTRKFRWSAGPALLAADLHRAGFSLRNPPIFHRVGIPGSGGPDWLRSDYEWIVCATRPGKLPWSDNTAAGHPPKWAPGGAMSYRTLDGERVNKVRVTKAAAIAAGKSARQMARDQGDRLKSTTSGTDNNGTSTQNTYVPPAKANPGNIIRCTVGGGRMGGDEFSSQNEAPFPEALATFFVKSFAQPGGLVCDPFTGSGTTGAVAVRHGRRFAGCDIRQSQVELAKKRISEETPQTLFTE